MCGVRVHAAGLGCITRNSADQNVSMKLIPINPKTRKLQRCHGMRNDRLDKYNKPLVDGGAAGRDHRDVRVD